MDFTFIVRVNAEGYEAQEMGFADDRAAVEGARTVLQATLDFRPLAAEAVTRATVGVGRGRLFEDDRVDWLGEWEWEPEEEDWCWTPSPVIGRASSS